MDDAKGRPASDTVYRSSWPGVHFDLHRRYVLRTRQEYAPWPFHTPAISISPRQPACVWSSRRRQCYSQQPLPHHCDAACSGLRVTYRSGTPEYEISQTSVVGDRLTCHDLPQEAGGTVSCITNCMTACTVPSHPMHVLLQHRVLGRGGLKGNFHKASGMHVGEPRRP
jgi:hypothetical protein